jgi:hypothetical protein
MPIPFTWTAGILKWNFCKSCDHKKTFINRVARTPCTTVQASSWKTITPSPFCCLYISIEATVASVATFRNFKWDSCKSCWKPFQTRLKIVPVLSREPYTRAFRTRPFRRTRTRTQAKVRNSDSDLRNRDFPTPWPKIMSQWNTYDVLTIVDICACGL